MRHTIKFYITVLLCDGHGNLRRAILYADRFYFIQELILLRRDANGKIVKLLKKGIIIIIIKIIIIIIILIMTTKNKKKKKKKNGFHKELYFPY